MGFISKARLKSGAEASNVQDSAAQASNWIEANIAWKLNVPEVDNKTN